MGISSEEARRAQFSGTEYSYDAADVEAFRARVVATLEEFEMLQQAGGSSAEPAGRGEELAEAQRIRHQAVELAERMLRDVMGAAGDQVSGLAAWQEAAMLRALAEEEMAFAREEARRLPAVAAAERDEMREKYGRERAAVRRELQNELQASRAAAISEAEEIRQAAAIEAAELVQHAAAQAEEQKHEAALEMGRIERRLAVLHSALADAESRFRRLAATAANEVGTLAALADQDMPGSVTEPDLHVATVDLTDDGVGQAEEAAGGDEEDAPAMIGRNRQVGFYERRLAGLRDRLEKSGHPPE